MLIITISVTFLPRDAMLARYMPSSCYEHDAFIS